MGWHCFLKVNGLGVREEREATDGRLIHFVAVCDDRGQVLHLGSSFRPCPCTTNTLGAYEIQLLNVVNTRP